MKQFLGHLVYKVATKDMAREMAAFPWKAPTALELAQEADAVTAGFTSSRQADVEQVTHAKVSVAQLLASGVLEQNGQAVLLCAYGDGEPKPRSRGLLLALQAIINDLGLPAFLRDHTVGEMEDTEGNTFTRYAADLLVVYPK